MRGVIRERECTNETILFTGLTRLSFKSSWREKKKLRIKKQKIRNVKRNNIIIIIIFFYHANLPEFSLCLIELVYKEQS
jgi:hypothetical protein